jgi:hypothetical protein
MTRSQPAARLAVALVALAAIGGCAQRGSSGRVQASAATMAACRSRADEVYLKQNRAEVYQNDTYISSTRDAPYASSGLPGITTDGLGGQYQRDQMIDDCINASEGSERVTITNPASSIPASDIPRGTAPPPPRP